MRTRRIGILIAWVLSLVMAGLAGSATAQRSDELRMVFGDDVGFRIDRVAPNGARVGTLMLRVNGKRVEAEFGTRVRPVR